MPRLAAWTGSPTPLPGKAANTGTPARSPSTCSCCTAFGRCMSAATSSGVLFCDFSQSASLAASVVLPEPCRPASMITVGGTLANRSRLASPPRIATSSSLTILMTCWAGLSASETSAPLARSLTLDMNSPDDGQRDVGLKQRDPDLPAGGVDVSLGQPPPPAQRGENLIEPIGKCLEHVGLPSSQMTRLLVQGYRVAGGNPACCRAAATATRRRLRNARGQLHLVGATNGT